MRYVRDPLNRPGLYFKGSSSSNKVEDTSDQKELARIAAERWQRYQDVYVPAENKYIQEVQNYDNPQRMAQVAGQANASVQGSFSQALNQDVTQMTSAGVNPAAPAFKSAIADNADRRAAADVNTTTGAQQAVQNAKVGGLQNVVAIGNNQSTEALTSMQDVAGASAQNATNKAIRDYSSSQANETALGTVAGAGTRAAIAYDNRKTGSY